MTCLSWNEAFSSIFFEVVFFFIRLNLLKAETKQIKAELIDLS